MIVALIAFLFVILAKASIEADTNLTRTDHIPSMIITVILGMVINILAQELFLLGYIASLALLFQQFLLYISVFDIAYNVNRGNEWDYIGKTSHIDGLYHEIPEKYKQILWYGIKIVSSLLIIILSLIF